MSVKVCVFRLGRFVARKSRSPHDLTFAELRPFQDERRPRDTSANFCTGKRYPAGDITLATTTGHVAKDGESLLGAEGGYRRPQALLAVVDPSCT